MKIKFAIVLIPLWVGCASTPEPPVGESPAESAVLFPEIKQTEPIEQIDLDGLERSLGLNSPFTSLGYAETSFDTCRAGYGYSATHRCRNEIFVRINFRLQCRDSEGTVSTALGSADIRPLSGRTVTWSIRDSRGSVTLNAEGYGRIRMTARRSMREQRLKLVVGNQNLHTQAGEMTRVVVPRRWCYDSAE